MAETSPPADPDATPEPWTFRIYVTAACTRYGTAPHDQDTGAVPRFDNPDQARQELTRNQGWHSTARPGQPEELLCPACAAAAGKTPAPPPAPQARSEPGTAPWWEQPGQHRELPANAAILPAAGTTQES